MLADRFRMSPHEVNEWPEEMVEDALARMDAEAAYATKAESRRRGREAVKGRKRGR